MSAGFNVEGQVSCIDTASECEEVPERQEGKNPLKIIVIRREFFFP